MRNLTTAGIGYTRYELLIFENGDVIVVPDEMKELFRNRY